MKTRTHWLLAAALVCSSALLAGTAAAQVTLEVMNPRGEIPPPPSWLPATIRTLLATLLAPDPAGRPPTAAAAADLIQGVLADAPENYQAAVATRVQKFRRSTPPWE